MSAIFNSIFILSNLTRMKCFFCLFLSALVLQMNAQDFLTYQTPKYSIEYLRDWSLDSTGNAGTELMILSKLQDEEDQYEDAITLTVLQYTPSDDALKTFSEQHLNDLKIFYQDIKISTDEFISHGGAPCRHYVVDGKFSNVGVILEEYVWSVNDKIYLLAYNSQTEGYEKLSAAAKKILQSFRFKL